LALSTQGVRGIGFTDGDDNGPFLNVVFAAEEPIEVWRTLRASLLESQDFGAALAASSMVMCTGREGWDDYLLLHHFDRTVPLDAPSMP
jgi:hypothetical protein